MNPRTEHGDLCILVPSCDRYSDIWPAYFQLMHHYSQISSCPSI